MTCVNHEIGVVRPKKFGLLPNWQSEYTIEDDRYVVGNGAKSANLDVVAGEAVPMAAL